MPDKKNVRAGVYLPPDAATMIAFPNAKINIGLSVTARRPDGYHELETVFYPVAVRDVLEVVEAGALRFSSSGLPIPGHPGQNLCLKAYHLLAARYPLPPVHIHLHKNIPMGAGLGGGSADAAVLIRLLNDKFSLGMGMPEMEDYCRLLGADCAFFLHNRAVFARGRGDIFEPVTLSLQGLFLVLLHPGLHVSTAEAFRGIVPGPALHPLEQGLKQSPGEWKSLIVNDFERPVFALHPVLAEIKRALYESGAVYASMSGSGSSVYGIFETLPAIVPYPGMVLYSGPLPAAL